MTTVRANGQDGAVQREETDGASHAAQVGPGHKKALQFSRVCVSVRVCVCIYILYIYIRPSSLFPDHRLFLYSRSPTVVGSSDTVQYSDHI